LYFKEDTFARNRISSCNKKIILEENLELVQTLWVKIQDNNEETRAEGTRKENICTASVYGIIKEIILIVK
jgi:hypothetical protein